MSSSEHIYLLNFETGIIIAQFGNQGSNGPGKFLSVSWHPSYEYFISTRENGGLELWKIDSVISNHVLEAFHTNKVPGKFFRKYVDVRNITHLLSCQTHILHLLTVDAILLQLGSARQPDRSARVWSPSRTCTRHDR